MRGLSLSLLYIIKCQKAVIAQSPCEGGFISLVPAHKGTFFLVERLLNFPLFQQGFYIASLRIGESQRSVVSYKQQVRLLHSQANIIFGMPLASHRGFYPHVAQLVEHLVEAQGVGSASLSARTN